MLAKWITQLTATGHPARHPIIREMAEQIRLQHVTSVNDNSAELVHYRPLGKHWVT